MSRRFPVREVYLRQNDRHFRENAVFGEGHVFMWLDREVGGKGEVAVRK